MCERHNHLLAVYQRTLRTLGISVDALQAAIAISPIGTYQKILEFVEEARTLSEHAWITLANHVYEDGCEDCRERLRDRN